MLELFNGPVTLEKFSGKGAWTYAPVGVLAQAPKTHFGVLKVTGRIDEVMLNDCALMPMGQGRRFLAVNAALRKQLGKQAGDVVQLQLFAQEERAALEHISLADFTDCLAEVPAALRTFQALPLARQQAWLRWVDEAEADEQKVTRVEAALALLERGQAAVPAGSA
ncbi:YdeI/OmpD-associated family protein [Hymenobacter saemangeumensis]|uniref:YdeI/OmpD-associated family protein n=1 Tax=Hymenobacter saemangeumensis TaxID=1084522 RepID=A0ABP8I778_9BACT